MLILKVPAVIAAVLFMSSVSAQAMEFADRPGVTFDVVSAGKAIQVTQSDDCSRRQIHKLNVLLTSARTKLVGRPGTILNVIQNSERPGRLSAEFSNVDKRSGFRFEYGPGELASWLKPTATAVAMKFEDRPGPSTARFKTLAAVSGDSHILTSSLAKPKPPVGVHVRPSAFCVGSIAPCGPLSFAQRPERQGS
jgi:hypothetical protein